MVNNLAAPAASSPGNQPSSPGGRSRASRRSRGSPAVSRGKSRPRTREFKYEEDSDVEFPDDRIPRLPIITCNVRKELKNLFECNAVDVSDNREEILVACDKCVYLFSYEWRELHRFGRPEGNVHKNTILSVKFHPDGDLFASGGKDKRVVVWSIETRSTCAVLDGHVDDVTSLGFNKTGNLLYTSSLDGKILVWKWRKKKIVYKYAVHSSGVKQFCSKLAHRMISACLDGTLHLWDTAKRRHLATVKPDDLWDPQGGKGEPILAAWMQRKLKHTGSVLSVASSPNGRLMATGSNDHTCKIWDILSFSRDYRVVCDEKRIHNETDQFYDRPFSIAHDELDCFPDREEELGEMRAGEVFINTGYHADVIFTLRLEGPCTFVDFSFDSKLVFTASKDCTCKMWSCESGDPLFQVNVPSPVRGLSLARQETEMYIILDDRVIILDVVRHSRSAPLPIYWEEQIDDQLYDYKDGKFQEKKVRAPTRSTPSTYVNASRSMTANSDIKPPPERVGLNLEDVKKALAQGTVAPSYLANLLTQFPDIDGGLLFQKMKEFHVKPNALLRIMASGQYHPKDLLQALTNASSGESLFKGITMGFPITPIMEKLGYGKVEVDPTDPVIFLEKDDVGPKYKKGISKLKNVMEDTPFKKMLLLKKKGKEKEESPTQGNKAISQLSFTATSASSKGKIPTLKAAVNKAKEQKMIKFQPAQQRRLVHGIEALKDTADVFIKQAFGKEETKYPNFGFDGPREIKTPLIDTQPPATTPKPGSRPTNETKYLEKQQKDLQTVSTDEDYIRKSKLAQEIAKGKARMTGKYGTRSIHSENLAKAVGEGGKKWSSKGTDQPKTPGKQVEFANGVSNPTESDPKSPQLDKSKRSKSIYYHRHTLVKGLDIQEDLNIAMAQEQLNSLSEDKEAGEFEIPQTTQNRAFVMDTRNKDNKRQTVVSESIAMENEKFNARGEYPSEGEKVDDSVLGSAAGSEQTAHAEGVGESDNEE
eukprot:Nk52_evm56s745 gene=Nk52_evmTU56s745